MTFFAESRHKPINDPDYAEFKARIKSWDDVGTYWHDLELRPCTREELGLGAPETLEQAKFYEPSGNAKAYLEIYWQQLFCYDDIVPIHGNFDSIS